MMSMYKKIKDLATFYENNGLNREKNNTLIHIINKILNDVLLLFKKYCLYDLSF